MIAPSSLAPGRSRAGLSLAQRGSAILAGTIGLGLVALGCNLIGLVVALAVFFLALASAFGTFASGDASSAVSPEAAAQAAAVDLWGVPSWAFIVVGVVLIAAGVIGSVWLLRHAHIARAWAITWSGVGIAVFPGLVFVVPSYALATFATNPLVNEQTSDDTALLFIALFMVALDVVLAALLGAFVWWWMAHVFRPRDV